MDRILKDIKLGEPLSVIKVNQYQQWKHKGDYPNDVLYIVHKDKNGKKDLTTIPNPKQEIFFTKPEYRHMWNLTRDSMPRDMLYPVMVKPQFIISEIYKQIIEDGDASYTKRYHDIMRVAKETNDNKMKRELHKYPHVFMSDLSLTDSYRLNLSLQYNTQGQHKIKKSFMDIETDIYGLSEKDTKIYNKDKINAITFCLNYDPSDPESDKKHVFTLMLRDYKRYPTQRKFEENIDSFKDKCEKTFNKLELTVADDKVIHESDYQFHFLFFDNEGDLLYNFYKIAHSVDPDMMAIWNIEFDIPKICARATINGINPTDMLSHPKYPKEARYLEINTDRRGWITHANRKTNIQSSSMFMYVDQMLLYAGMNKGSKSIPDYSLDTVLGIEIGWGKRKFKNGWTIRDIAIMDYEEFILYSITDTLAQEVLECYTSHMTTAFIDTQTAACPLEYTTKPTMYTRNYYHFQKLKMFDMIPGNNPNTDYIDNMTAEKYELILEVEEAIKEAKEEEDEEDFIFEDDVEEELYKQVVATTNFDDGIDIRHPLGGGIVGDPNLNIHNGEELIEGMPSKHVFKGVLDFDFASEYPWIKYTRNLGKETEIGRLIFNKRIHSNQNPYNNDIYLPGAEFISDYISGDWLSMGVVYFNLPSVMDIIKEARELENNNLQKGA